MAAFQFTPDGIAPLPDSAFSTTASVEDVMHSPLETESKVLVPRKKTSELAKPIEFVSDEPINVVALAKARLRNVKQDLIIKTKQVEALKKERDELSRLLAAASNKSRTIVRGTTSE